MNDDLIIDKKNNECLYNDEHHIYWNENTKEKYTSVTTLIHKYTQEFDSNFWSAYKALEFLLDENIFSNLKKSLLTVKKIHPSIFKKFNIDEEEFKNKQNEILLSYDEERIKSCKRGTKIHSEFENKFYNQKECELKNFGINGNFPTTNHYYELDLNKGIYPEYLLSNISSDGILKIAGQIDLLVKDNNDIWIIDWKTNKEIKTKSYYNRNTRAYECMKFPLNNLMDCNYIHYTLQLSLYAYLLQQINPEFIIKKLMLFHIDHNDKETQYELEYLKDDVERLLKHYKKQLKIQIDLNKDTPIKL